MVLSTLFWTALAGVSCAGPPYQPRRIVAPDASYNVYTAAQAPRELREDEMRGIAVWYGARHHGRRTASGEPFDMYRFTAAHKTLPFQSLVRVTRDDTRQSVVVRITDRGPFSESRVIDLSWAAAYDLGIVERGTVPVHLELLRWGAGNEL